MSNNGSSRNQIVTVDIDRELYQRLKNKAGLKRYNTKEYVNEMLKLLLDKEEFLQNIAPYLSVNGYHENRVTLLDTSERGELVDVYMINKRLECDKDKKSDCMHTWFVWAIPELAHLNIVEPSQSQSQSKETGKKKLVEILA